MGQGKWHSCVLEAKERWNTCSMPGYENQGVFWGKGTPSVWEEGYPQSRGLSQTHNGSPLSLCNMQRA